MCTLMSPRSQESGVTASNGGFFERLQSHRTAIFRLDRPDCDEDSIVRRIKWTLARKPPSRSAVIHSWWLTTSAFRTETAAQAKRKSHMSSTNKLVYFQGAPAFPTAEPSDLGTAPAPSSRAPPPRTFPHQCQAAGPAPTRHAPDAPRRLVRCPPSACRGA